MGIQLLLLLVDQHIHDGQPHNLILVIRITDLINQFMQHIIAHLMIQIFVTIRIDLRQLSIEIRNTETHAKTVAHIGGQMLAGQLPLVTHMDRSTCRRWWWGTAAATAALTVALPAIACAMLPQSKQQLCRWQYSQMAAHCRANLFAHQCWHEFLEIALLKIEYVDKSIVGNILIGAATLQWCCCETCAIGQRGTSAAAIVHCCSICTSSLAYQGVLASIGVTVPAFVSWRFTKLIYSLDVSRWSMVWCVCVCCVCVVGVGIQASASSGRWS